MILARTTSRSFRPSRGLGWTVVAVLLALFAVAMPGAPADAAERPSLECGVQPTTDVRLREDLTCDATIGSWASTSTPTTVDVDLGGHTLTVTNGTCSYFWRCGALFNVASVSNGTVIGDLKDVRQVRRVHVRGSVYFAENFTGTWLMDRSIVSGGRVGLFGSNVTLSNNRIYGSGPLGGGIQFLDALHNVSNITIVANRLSGVGINMYDSCGSCAGDIQATIRRNTIVGGGISITGQLESLGPIDIVDNTIRHTTGDGLFVAAPFLPATSGGPVTVTGNRFGDVAGRAVNVEWMPPEPGSGVIDGGGNVAVRVGTKPACIGIICSTR